MSSSILQTCPSDEIEEGVAITLTVFPIGIALTHQDDALRQVEGKRGRPAIAVVVER